MEANSEEEIFTDENSWVSIHASEWRRTETQYTNATKDLFQYTPPSGGERGIETLKKYSEEFQYTPPSGGELRISLGFLQMWLVSIHASEWRRTLIRMAWRVYLIRFNTRLRVEANYSEIISEIAIVWFQYTPPSGGELNNRFCILWKISFQYTPPSGGEQITIEELFTDTKSFNTRLRVEANSISKHSCHSTQMGFNTRLRVEANINRKKPLP